ncbi:ATP-binding protein [Aquibacillus kalidii]|uniref:ATP-binding protein n=1 Tax=Aquibacillus kalidii TaxID=2762597 RepID=UPI001646FF39|nr:AAA family ATPase [Aquibacillus kalidii]
MIRKIHIMGASGSGTSTLGSALSMVLPHTHLDTDDYFWATKFTEQREIPERRRMLEEDLLLEEKWILSGAVCGWGDHFKSYFDLVIFLWIPQEIRLERLKQRELQRYGNEMLVGGSRYEQSKAFLEWASLYDSAGMEVRSKALHEYWMADLSCPVLKMEGNYSIREKVEIVIDYLKHN